MKKIIICCMLLIEAATTFSQQNVPLPTLTKQDYLLKSHHQKTVAWIMLGGGSAFFLTGIIIPRGDLVRETFFLKRL